MSDDNKLTLNTFTALVAARAKVSNVEANAYIHQLATTISEELEAGDYVHLYHFGRFHTTHVDEQAGHDPNTGAPLTIPAHSRVHFRPYSALRFAVNAPFRQLRIRELTPEKTAWRIRTAAWILLLLIVVLLIMLGIKATGWLSTQEETQVPSEVQFEVQPEAPSGVQPEAPSGVQPEAPPEVQPEAPSGVQSTPAPEVSSDKTVVGQTEQTPDADAATTVPAAAVEPDSAPSKTAATEVIVSPGDTLWGIAATRLGDSAWWPIIYVENRPALPRRNPDLIGIGITLRIPALTGSVNSPSAADLRLRANGYQIVARDYQRLGNPRAAAYRKVADQWSME